MKTHFSALLLLASLGALTSCNETKAKYVDLNSGRELDLGKDEETGLLVDPESGKPVELYVDRETGDTVHGPTGKVVNGYLVKRSNGDYVYEAPLQKVQQEATDANAAKSSGDVKEKWDDGEYKIKRKGYKKEVEKDGDITIKDGNKKIKIDGETGERKVKYDD